MAEYEAISAVSNHEGTELAGNTSGDFNFQGMLPLPFQWLG